MQELIREAKQAESDLIKGLSAATTSEEVEGLRVGFLGRDGVINKLLSSLKQLSIEDKREVGPTLNAIRANAAELLQATKIKVEAIEAEIRNKKKVSFDLTAYKTTGQLTGTRHIYTSFIEEVEDIFLSLGFAVFDGPEVETDFYNFSALNIPQDHPARDMHDTFWIEPGKRLLRTHTSPVQIRALQQHGVPIAACVPGRVFRNEATDATHEATFTQCEGLLVDKGVNLSHLFGVAQVFLKRLFNSEKIKVRMRPGFFPFVEPGVEIDMSCIFCKTGCSICKQTGWIELCGAGLIHPNVLRAVNIDPKIYSGFAFGFGIERLAMLRHNIDEIRLFHSGKIAFLTQF